MAFSSYFSYRHNPGINGNSIYFPTDDQFTGSVITAEQESTLDLTKDIMNPTIGDTTFNTNNFSKINKSNGGSNPFIPESNSEIKSKSIIQNEIKMENDKIVPNENVVSIYATPTLNNINQEKPLVNTATIMQDHAGNIMPYQEILVPPTESAYIGMPNLYNCINSKTQKYSHNIPSPIIAKYVIEGTTTAVETVENTEFSMMEAKKSCKETENLKQIPSENENDETYDDESEACNTYKFDTTSILSDYAFNVENYGNISENLLLLNASDKAKLKDLKDEILVNEQKFPNPNISNVESNPEKCSASAIKVPEKQYIQSYYNAEELSQWKIY